MTRSIPIPESVRALYPKSANRTITVADAWRPEDSTLERPAFNGTDGWTRINRYATLDVLKDLQAQGFTWVNFSAGGVARRYVHSTIAALV